MAPTSPVLAELRGHEVPAWWRDAGLGIFIHWTPASVPGWAPTDRDLLDILTAKGPHPFAEMPYTEWYQNSLRFPDSSVSRFHRERYGDRAYETFADDFNAGLDRWDPAGWAEQFAAAGARYVVLVTKHHDGFCLWPSDVPNPHRPGWHTERDVVGELADAVRAAGMRFGVYYSGGLDWTFDDRPIPTMAAGAAAVPQGDYPAYAAAHVRELIERYQPSVLWNDIAWPQPADDLWPLLRDYYRAVPDGVVNDRWLPWSRLNTALRVGPLRRLADAALRRAATKSKGLVPPKPPHFDVRTPEYTALDERPPWPWECVRGMDRSFGYNRNSRPEHFLARDELLSTLESINANGGNLLLNVGPRGEDAAIPAEQVERLAWLAQAASGGRSGGGSGGGLGGGSG
ncbi:MAG TPA: alpha-L-fucosidase [Acidimicrobiales bacterium]|jgi:alpha-L-fucosidase|nr:alpha-L-fucosidase [Acidimicrobiales bacterium]